MSSFVNFLGFPCPAPPGEWSHLWPDGSNVSKNRSGYYGNGEGSREVVVPAVTLVSQVECLLELTRLCRQCHLTQEGILQHVVIVDLKDQRGTKKHSQEYKRLF